MGELRALTALRGLAAFYVVLLHFSTAVQRHTDGVIPALAPRGHLAVDFFFVLSGFIMAYSYADEFQQRGNWAAMPSFLLKRVARVMPLHWFVTALVLIYTLLVSPGFTQAPTPAFSSPTPWRDLFLNVFLLQGFGLARNMNGPSWSISVEMLAYLIFPLFLALMLARAAVIRWVAIALALAALVGIAVTQGKGTLSLMTDAVGWTVLRSFCEFALGVAVYREFATRRHAAFFGSDGFVFAVSLLALAMMLLRLWDLVAVLAFPLIVLGVALNRGKAAALLGARLPYFLGVTSFSLYLIHWPLAYLQLQAVQALHPALLSKPLALSLAALGSLSMIPISWLVYETVEKPGRAAIRGLADRLAKSGFSTRRA